MARKTRIYTCAICGVRRAALLSPMWPTGRVPECEECHLTCAVAILCDCPVCARYVRNLPAADVADWAFGWSMEKWPTSEGYEPSDVPPVQILK
jgi:hypothetical protein